MTVEEAIRQKVEAEMTLMNLYVMNAPQTAEYKIDFERKLHEARFRLAEANAVLQHDLEKAGKKP